MAPVVEYVEYDGRKIQNEATFNRLRAAIESRDIVPVRDILASTGDSPQEVKKCTIMYHTGDGVRKRRTLGPDQSFDFANDIWTVHFGYEVTDISDWEKLFAIMDTTGKFLVTNDFFGTPEKVKNSGFEIQYLRPDGRLRYQVTKQGREYDFNATEGTYKFPPRTGQKPNPPKPNPPQPDPPKPDPPGPAPPQPTPPRPNVCLCPCPICAENHQTKEQREEQKERERKEEQDRKAELEELKRSISVAHEQARNAGSAAERANNGVKETKTDIRNIYRELADIRKELRRGGEGDSGNAIPPLFKVCIVSSQILALVVLASYTYKAIIQGKKM